MSRETRLPGCRSTSQAGCQIGFLAAVFSRRSTGRDSASHFQANATFTKQSPAATSPGAAGPKVKAKEAMAGPRMTPAAVADESQPRARARSLGSTVSATYAGVRGLGASFRRDVVTVRAEDRGEP